MNQEQIMMFDQYIKMKHIPILLEDVPLSAFKNVTVLDANCDISELNGHYEGMDFVGPDWYRELQKNSEVIEPVLILNDINQLPLQEQTKFIEILKYKKISTFDLPKNCIIIALCSNLKEHPLHEEVYTLMAHITE